MGKKVKKRARGGQKENRGPNVVETETQDDGGAVVKVVKDREACCHIEKGVNLERLSAKWPAEFLRCEDCRENFMDRRGNRAKGKQGKKGGANSKSESKAIWICLECGHFSCGGVGLPTTPQSHALKHSKLNRHSLAIHSENHQLIWCFRCSELIAAEKFEDSSEQKGALHEVVKLLKNNQSTIDVEDVWFGSASKSEPDYFAKDDGDQKPGYLVRGLTNLGNTCFFNSILQNLLAINRLRDYFYKLDESVGPLTASLGKLFFETSVKADLRGVINPRSLFVSVCSKAPQFRGYQQHDSHELLRCLIDGLSSEELRKHARTPQADERTLITDPTFVDTIFGGKLASTVTCLECGYSSTTFEPVLDLSLPVPNKKPQCKRVQSVTKGKKPKVPPQRTGKIRPKLSKYTNTHPVECVSEKSTGDISSSEVLSREQMVQPSGESSLSAPIDSNAMAHEMGLTHQDLSAIQRPENQQSVDDSFAWLDYLDPTSVSNGMDVASETDENSVNQVSSDEGVLHNDLQLRLTLDAQNAAAEAYSDSERQLDFLEQGILAQQSSAVSHSEDNKIANSQFENEPHENSQFDEKLPPEGSLTKEVVEGITDLSHSSASWNQACSKDLNGEMDCSGRKSENPEGVLDSKILLLPCKDASSNVQVSDRDEQDFSSFDGFADMFNEPESTYEVSDIAKTGVTIENNSDSDPDEVDDTNAPISVESCLDLFMKPERLSKEEHGWRCDNCSKSLRERMISSTIPLYAGRNSHDVDSVNRDVEESAVDTSCVRSLHETCDIYGNGDCMSHNQPKTEMNVITCQFETEAHQKINADKCESEHSNEDADLEKSKVKSDATKSTLINKAPSILTVHLKRFTPDARGRWIKLKGHVKFRETIDLKPYMDHRSIDRDTYAYRLVGVVEHSGTMRGGHYIAYVRGTTSNGSCTWYYASDAHVSQVSLEEVLRSEAYILFYEAS